MSRRFALKKVRMEQPKLITGEDQQLLLEVALDKINQFFICPICQGYFRDAHTVPECLHTFCKSCLIIKLREVAECPQCKAKTNPSNIGRPDRHIQSLFQKLYLDVEKLDEEAEKKFYLDNNIPMPEVTKPVIDKNKGKRNILPDKTVKRARSTEGVASSSSRTPVKIKLTLQAENPDMKIDKPYIEASGGLRVETMRDYVAEKLNVAKDKVILSCQGEVLSCDHTTEFVQRTKWQDSNTVMVWTFKVL